MVANDYNTYGGSGKSWRTLGLIILAITIVLAVILHAHATQKHGADAITARDCLKNNGPTQVWRGTADKDRFYLLCTIVPPDPTKGKWGKYAIQIIDKTGHEITAFVRDAKSWAEFVNYIGRSAVRYLGDLPWLVK